MESAFQDVLESIEQLREHDVPYHQRFSIDKHVQCGSWYTVYVRVRMHGSFLLFIETMSSKFAQNNDAELCCNFKPVVCELREGKRS